MIWPVREQISCPICEHAESEELLRRVVTNPRGHLDSKLTDIDFVRNRILFEKILPGRESIEFSFKICRECGLIFFSPRCEEVDMVVKYQMTDELGDVQEREKVIFSDQFDYSDQRAFEIYRTISKIQKIQNQNVLDLGGAQGLNLKYFTADNTCYVVDYQKRDLINDVTYLGKNTKNIPDSMDFGSILFCHTLEHVVNPVSELRHIKNILTPGGILYIEVPLGCWREYREMRNFLTHLNFFSTGSLGHLLDMCGFNIRYLKGRPALLRAGYARAILIAIAENSRPRNTKINGYRITRKQMKSRHYGLLIYKLLLEARLKKFRLLKEVLRYTKQSNFYRALSIPARKLVLKVVGKTKKEIGSLRQRRVDSIFPTFMKTLRFPIQELHHYLRPETVEAFLSSSGNLSEAIELYLAHHFNLLGSGWLQVKHGMFCKGIEGSRYEMRSPVYVDSEGHWLKGRINPSNLQESQRIWSLVDHEYIPIDWHLDFKSGYRWSEDNWYLDIPHGHKLGVDIKVPWELARMQHLPHLVWAYTLAADGEPGSQPPEVYVREFRNQVLDFIATNPPRFGVNWKSPMDVGIRVVNWLVTYDLFRAYGARFDNEFETEFFCSIYQHGHHLINNLEWNNEIRGNHYLSNVVSLLFVASYLPCTPETDVWLAFSIQELIKEVEFQFTQDGANFEASTSYHRLSTEMVIYATALILGLPKEKQVALRNYDFRLLKILPKLKAAPVPLYALPGSEHLTPFPPWYLERLEKMAEFTLHITKPSGKVIQIGDNDSGRLLKLQPLLESKSDCSSPDENHLDHRHLVAAMNSLFGREDFTAFAGQGWLETEIVRSLAGNTYLPSYLSRTKGGKEHNESKLYAYPDFGLYVYRSVNTYLAVRCGSIGQNGNGGHAHNDNLSFELNVGGKDFIVDGGSYLYTAVPKIRNEFRSTRAHNTLSIHGFEQNRWKEGLDGLFFMKNDVTPRVIKYNEECFEGEYSSNGIAHGRSFRLGRSNIVIEDIVKAGLFGGLNLNLAPGVEITEISKNGSEEFALQIKNDDTSLRIILQGFSRVGITKGFFSAGYGERLENQMLKCLRSNSVTKVIIEIG